jgi:SSS family solute:Na+ symporter
MAGILGGYRWFAFLGGLVLIPLCAYTIMHHPAYADKAARAQSILDKISNPEIRDQMITPVVMHQFVPFGLKGCFAAAMLAALISNFSSQLHSWGSIFVQDVILPLKKTRLSPKAHLLLLKASVVMVAVFVIIFSCLFRQTQRFQTYVMVSATVYLGGAGIALVGGLYWRKGTTAAAWTAMLTGAAISVFAIIIEQCWVEIYGKNFPIDFKWWAAIAMSVSSCFYIVVSLLSSGNFNIEKMLHRGQYRVKDDNEVETSEKRKSWLEILGVSKEFTLFDKCVWWFSMSQTIFLFLYALIVTIVYLTAGFSDKVWRNCHLVWLWMMIILLPIPVAIWLTIGGFHDYISFFRNLRKAKQNALDDGSVVDHHNLSDES